MRYFSVQKSFGFAHLLSVRGPLAESRGLAWLENHTRPLTAWQEFCIIFLGLIRIVYFESASGFSKMGEYEPAAEYSHTSGDTEDDGLALGRGKIFSGTVSGAEKYPDRQRLFHRSS